MFCELSDLGCIKIHGNDAKKFLQGQLTCDVNSPSMGAHCNPQGRVVSLFYQAQLHDDYFLLMQRSMVALTLSALKRYAIFFKVIITDVSDEWQAMGMQDVDEIDLQSRVCIPVGQSCHIIAGSKESISQLQKDIQHEVMSLAYWKVLMMDEGIPTIYPETSGKFLPHDLNLHKLNAISFDKGCYTGQEIIARMHYRGKLKNLLCKADVFCEIPPQPGSDVYTLQGEEYKPAGVVVDAAPALADSKCQLLIITNEQSNLFLGKQCQKNYELYLHN